MTTTAPSKENLTSEFKISAFLYALFIGVNKDPKHPVSKTVSDFELNPQVIMTALKDLNILKNVGGKTRAAEWSWIGPQVSEALSKQVFSKYCELIRIRKDREASPVSGSIFIMERIDLLNDRIEECFEMLRLMCDNLGIKR